MQIFCIRFRFCTHIYNTINSIGIDFFYNFTKIFEYFIRIPIVKIVFTAYQYNCCFWRVLINLLYDPFYPLSTRRATFTYIHTVFIDFICILPSGNIAISSYRCVVIVLFISKCANYIFDAMETYRRKVSYGESDDILYTLYDSCSSPRFDD